jgi:organic radical activating enzyme
MLLVRFKHCNRSDKKEEGGMNKPCPYCDTAVIMRISQESDYGIFDLQREIDIDKLVGLLITGGEPGFGINLNKTLLMLNSIDYKISNVETNGCNLLKLIDNVDKTKNVIYSMSPKLFSDEDIDFYFDLTAKIKENKNVYIKLVYQGTEINNKFLDYLKEIDFPNERIYLMPEGKDRDELIKNSEIVFDACEKYKTQFSSREHIIYKFI